MMNLNKLIIKKINKKKLQIKLSLILIINLKLVK